MPIAVMPSLRYQSKYGRKRKGGLAYVHIAGKTLSFLTVKRGFLLKKF